MLALVGETGSGKSTLARCLALLERPDSGSIRFRDQDLLTLDRAGQRRLRREIQLIFQDPASALNPRFTAAEIVAEPLCVFRRSVTGSRAAAGPSRRWSRWGSWLAGPIAGQGSSQAASASDWQSLEPWCSNLAC